jgi:Trk K+ transport system NAD-binding subunit
LGEDVLRMLNRLDAHMVVVEYDPSRVVDLSGDRYPVIFGDATDEVVLEEAGVARARLVVSSIDQHQANLQILRRHQSLAPDVPIMLTATSVEDALAYYRMGAAYVILPFQVGNSAIAELVRDHWSNLDELSLAKLHHLKHLAAKGYK